MYSNSCSLSKVREICLVLAAICIISGIATYLYLSYRENEIPECGKEKKIFHGDAIASNGPECAAIGM